MKYLINCIIIILFASCSNDSNEILDKSEEADTSFPTIKIGNQTWMQVNLHPSFHNGEGLTFLTSYDMDEVSNTDKYYCYPNYENVEKYGALYTFEAAKNACPDGWRLPTDTEWQTLIDYIGEDAGKELKSAEDWNGNNLSEMNMLPAGFNAFSKGSHGLWWSASSNDDNKVWSRMLITALIDDAGQILDDTNVLYRQSVPKNYCLSVRCIKE